MANKLIHSTNVSYDDLVGAGGIGLVYAINGYDESRGNKFSTFATTCIKNEMLRLIKKEAKHRKVLYLDGEINDDEGESTGLSYGGTSLSDKRDFGETDLMSSTEEETLFLEDIKMLNKAVMKLPERERELIYHRFGIMGETPKTQREVSEILGLSQASVSKMEGVALRKLFHYLNGRVTVENHGYYGDLDMDKIKKILRDKKLNKEEKRESTKD